MGQNQGKSLKIFRELASQVQVTDFSDYKTYLSAIYELVRTSPDSSGYSYNQFSEHLGLGFGNVSWLIINSKRKMTAQSAHKISAALQLEEKQKKYLNALVSYVNAANFEVRQESLKKLLSLRNQMIDSSTEKLVLKFYSHWSHAVIFELVGLKDFCSEPDWIVNRLHTKISKKQVIESLQLLCDLNLIKFDDKQNKHIKLVDDFESPTSVPGIGVIQFHLKMIQLGMEALETVPAEHRDFSAVTMAVSKEGRIAIKQEIAAFRKYLMFMASKYTEKEEIVEINFQMFDLTKSNKGSRE